MQLGSLKADMPKAEVEKVMKSELVDTVIKEEVWYGNRNTNIQRRNSYQPVGRQDIFNQDNIIRLCHSQRFEDRR